MKIFNSDGNPLSRNLKRINILNFLIPKFSQLFTSSIIPLIRMHASELFTVIDQKHISQLSTVLDYNARFSSVHCNRCQIALPNLLHKVLLQTRVECFFVYYYYSIQPSLNNQENGEHRKLALIFQRYVSLPKENPLLRMIQRQVSLPKEN